MSAKSRQSSAGVLRRVGAGVYDLLLVIGLLMLVTLLLLAATGGEAIPAGDPAYQAALLAVTYAFFAGFWVHGGQTLGMRAWRLKLTSADGEAVSWSAATRRFLCAPLAWLPLGLGVVWLRIDKDQLAWHDRFSATRVILLPKRPP